MRKMLYLFLFMSVLFFYSCSLDEDSDKEESSSYSNRIVDHSNFNADLIPDSYLVMIKNMDVYFEHASVGGNIVSGLTNMSNLNSTRYGIQMGNWSTSSIDSTITNWYTSYNGFGDNQRGNPGFDAKTNDFYTRITTGNFGSLLDVASFKFCYIDDGYSGTAQEAFNRVKSVMDNLESTFQNTKFFWWTMPIQTTGSSAKDSYNSLVRNYCKNNNKYLLDIADIECHSSTGIKLVDSNGREILDSSYTDDGGHLNSTGALRVANAYWVMLAFIAGYSGN